MGGKSKSQTVGYHYYAGVMAVIGGVIERLVNIRPNDGAFLFSPETYDDPIEDILKTGNCTVQINAPEIFGGESKEGGWVGEIDVHTGKPYVAVQNEYLKSKIDENISAYPYMSYLVFRSGYEEVNRSTFDPVTNEFIKNKKGKIYHGGFRFVSMSNNMKEFLVCVKRTEIKPDGSLQWYNNDGYKIVSTIGDTTPPNTPPVTITPNIIGEFEAHSKRNPWCSLDVSQIVTETKTITKFTYVATTPTPFDEEFPYGCLWCATSPKSGLFELSFTIPIKGRAVVDMIFNTTNPNIVRDLEILPGTTSHVRLPYDGAYVVFRFELKSQSVANKTITMRLRAHSVFGDCFYNTAPPTPQHSYHFGYYGTTIVQSSYLDIGTTDGEMFDINPVHKIREILTDYAAMAKPESDINDSNFREAALRIYDEGLGISWALTEKSCLEAINELCYHIEAGLRVNRQTGLYEIILFRNDNITIAGNFNPSNINEFQADIVNGDDLINVANVEYYDRKRFKNSTFTLYDNGGVMTAGRENAQSVKFPYFMVRRNAEKVANWKLKNLATPRWQGSFKTSVYSARSINRYDVITITMPDMEMVNVSVRVTKISLGDGIDNSVTIDFIEVVELGQVYEIGEDEELEDDSSAKEILKYAIMEAPYYEVATTLGQNLVDSELTSDPDLGLVIAGAMKEQDNSLGARLYSNLGDSDEPQSPVAVFDYCPFSLVQPFSKTDTTLTVASSKDLDSTLYGAWGVIKETGEIVIFQYYDKTAGTLKVGRGALDTVPTESSNSASILFLGNDNGLDQTRYSATQTIGCSVRGVTPTGVSQFFTSVDVAMGSRAIRPYPPADVKYAGSNYPTTFSDDIVLTWGHRNRLQQTDGVPASWYDGNITPEGGLTYHLKVYDSSNPATIVKDLNIGLVNTYTVTAAELAGIFSVTVELYAVRDGYISWTKYVNTAENLTVVTAPYNLQGVYSA